MANNRLYLRCTRCGPDADFMLAKYFDRWSTRPELKPKPFTEALDDWFEEHSHGTDACIVSALEHPSVDNSNPDIS